MTFQCGWSTLKNHAVTLDVAKIIVISSGKGGVGKSTTAVNLALALLNQGKQVGLLDADIYGPNQAQMLGRIKRPAIDSEQRFLPIMAHGLQTMSIAYLVDAMQATIWRGPMVSKALQQLLYGTKWEGLDYLVIDLPPGTGDIQLTLAQKVKVNGAIIITTPQTVALLDARKAIAMWRKVGVKILGIVENMSGYICPECGHHSAIFGAKGGEDLAKEYHLPLLAQLPLDVTIRETTDHGQPTVISTPKSNSAMLYNDCAKKVIAQLAV